MSTNLVLTGKYLPGHRCLPPDRTLEGVVHTGDVLSVTVSFSLERNLLNLYL